MLEIKKANRGRDYFVLLILTDGALTDVEDTKNAIIRVCQFTRGRERRGREIIVFISDALFVAVSAVTKKLLGDLVFFFLISFFFLGGVFFLFFFLFFVFCFAFRLRSCLSPSSLLAWGRASLMSCKNSTLITSTCHAARTRPSATLCR